MTNNKDETDAKAVRKIDCDEVMRQLFDFLDNEVDIAAHDEIHEHIEECRSCFSRVEFEKQIKERVQGAGKDTAPESLQRKIAELMKGFSIGDSGKPDAGKK